MHTIDIVEITSDIYGRMKVKVKVGCLLYSDASRSQTRDRSTLQSRKWQLIGMS